MGRDAEYLEPCAVCGHEMYAFGWSDRQYHCPNCGDYALSYADHMMLMAHEECGDK